MVNLVAAQRPLLHGLMKMAGVVPHSVQIDAGTVMNIWVPSETLKKKPINRPTKPAVVLVHGFAAEGIVTWQFQVGSLTKKYAVYVPDLFFFGGSATDSPDRSPEFQARCLAKALRKLGVERCTVVGFSYGGMVAFKMAEMWPDLVAAVVVSGSILAMTDSISSATLGELGFSSSSELLLPTSVEGCKALLKVAVHRNLWFPDRLHRDFLQVMFNNRKERGELLEGLLVTTKETNIPNFTQRIHLLWGDNDQIFKLELAQNMKQQLGQKATLQSIKKAGHLVHLERPCVYNRCLKKFLASLQAADIEV
ncbi:alpha/beta-Hydrolases superfamily protein [Striga hermonthica]|uniref:Alpha/beta-Hydrolases superfamily protein n=1 Tax=Striga hermonthica TaxID=68872 RepID=A0A9N7RPX6_STRHE|nr:alpha/beta-Hydrolases superfamily protein [Striga hermonthica]